MNTKSFNAWLRELGYTWIGGEQLIKGFMSKGEAQDMISQLIAEGSVQRG